VQGLRLIFSTKTDLHIEGPDEDNLEDLGKCSLRRQSLPGVLLYKGIRWRTWTHFHTRKGQPFCPEDAASQKEGEKLE